jgi:hypothetical protein
MELFVHAQENPVLYRTIANMQGPDSIDRFPLSFGHAFRLQQMFSPGRDHHFDTEGVEPLQVFVQPPAEGAIS